MIENATINAALNSPTRNIGAFVEMWTDALSERYFSHTDAIKSITVERLGEESKFFGFGVCQKMNIKLLDVIRDIHITTANSLYVSYIVNDEYLTPYPRFDVAEVHRDENTNELSVTAYDAIYKASGRTVGELAVSSYTIEEFATACASLLGMEIAFDGIEAETLALSYENGANFDGSETIRSALDAIAEVTQSIYFVNSANILTFKRLVQTPVLTIGKDQYFTLKSGENRRLATIAHVTELGDNVSASITETGTTQYVRNNPFWDLRDDIGTLVDNALAAVGGFTINQFECAWRGNFLLEVGDCVELVTKDNGTALSFVLNDTIEYNGAMSGKMQWNYTESESDTATNPSNLGEKLTQTFAMVDKVNKQVDIVVSETSANTAQMSSISADIESITASVEGIKQSTDEALGAMGESVAEISQKVSTQITEDQMNIAIEKAVNDGVTKVETSTGFTFDEAGLRVSKSDSDISTQITEDGMQIDDNGDKVLTANHEGVNAKNLHATTYLIVGNNSRFEDYERGGDKRTGCFWIGG